MEIWVDIKGYEGLYQISNFGQVRSLPRMVKRSDGKMRRVGAKMLVGSDENIVCLSNKKKVTTPYRVASLVLQHFTNYDPSKFIATRIKRVSTEPISSQYVIKRKIKKNPVTIGFKNGKTRKFKSVDTAANALKTTKNSILDRFKTGTVARDTKIAYIAFDYPLYDTATHQPKLVTHIVDTRKNNKY